MLPATRDGVGSLENDIRWLVVDSIELRREDEVAGMAGRVGTPSVVDPLIVEATDDSRFIPNRPFGAILVEIGFVPSSPAISPTSPFFGTNPSVLATNDPSSKSTPKTFLYIPFKNPRT